MNWKKGLIAGVAAMITLMAVSGCGTTSSTPTSEPAKANTKLVIGLDDNYPPVGFRDKDGNLIGSDIELAKEAAKRLGVEVEFKPIDWSAKEAELNGKKIDAIWNGLTPTPEREKSILFTRPYQVSGQVIVVLKGSDMKGAADLAGKTVGTQDGSTAIDVLAKNPELEKSFKELKKYPDIVSALMDLKVGRLDAVLADEIAARYYIAQKNEGLEILPDRFGVEVDAVGVQLDNKELKEKLDKVLTDMEKDGTMKQIFMKWYGEDISYTGK